MRIPEAAPTLTEAFDLVRDPGRLRAVLDTDVRATVEGHYHHWEKIKAQAPPEGLDVREWWLGIKLARSRSWRELKLRDSQGRPFRFAMPDGAWAMVHEVDRNASGSLTISEEVTNPESRDRYIVNSLIEEAITSSQLEGASTTTPIAKDMIRSGRKPRDKDERMILNNYVAMKAIGSFREDPLSPKRVLDLHRVMTQDTLAPSQVGRIRRDDEYRVVANGEGNILHYPPPAGELEARMQAMCDFANEANPDRFIHPVVRAILVHFWLAYDHPFVDGNGRTARALFYWCMLRSGYWLCEYLSISRILKKAPAKYARAFLHTETDENDATYFVVHQLDVIVRSMRALHTYLRKKAEEVRQVETLLRANVRFNHRQLAVLSHALRHPDARYTIKSHQRSHNVVYETARTDLLDLAEKGLLTSGKHGRTYHFNPAKDLAAKLQQV